MLQISTLRAQLKPHIPFILRVGLGVVFLWSGLSKFGADSNPLGICTNRTEAIDFVSTLGWLPINPELFVTVQSILEIVLGLMLIIGWWVELAASISVVLYAIFFIMFDFSLIWKNVGLLAASLALLGLESDRWSLDAYWKRRPQPTGSRQV